MYKGIVLDSGYCFGAWIVLCRDIVDIGDLEELKGFKEIPEYMEDVKELGRYLKLSGYLSS
ncbi:unnamed protein product [Meloidogyne enterolobii]|uniref:Uncharacterized protein n=1 Tax=Meloidogyne enterolobii TaxID=390850 RepID=A0ACB1A6Z8_MELEN